MIASVFKRGRLWHGKVKLDSWAAERRFSLETTDLRVARSKLETMVRDFEKEAAGMVPALSIRDAALKPIGPFIESFLRDMEARQKAASTVKLYRGILLRLRKETGWETLHSVTVSSFCEWRSESALRAKSLNNCLNVWSRLFRWLKRQRLVVENPFEFVDPVDGRASAREYRRALVCDEVCSLLSTSPWPRNAVYRFILETATRRSEVRNLRLGDFHLDDGGADARQIAPTVTLGTGGALPTGTPPVPGRSASLPPSRLGGPCVCVPASIAKNRKTELKPLGPEVVADLRALFPKDAPPFQLAFARLVPTCSTFRKDLARAGIPFVDALGRRVDLHALRKTAGTALVLTGAEPRVVMEFMRHSDLKLTMKTYMDAAQLQGPVAAAVARLPWHSSASAQQGAAS